MQNRGPLVLALVLLFVPILYLGSYLALVGPRASVDASGHAVTVYHYRLQADVWASRIYWPLEKFDQWIRPQAWEDR